MPHSLRPGDDLSGRYRLLDLLDESRGGRFFRGFDSVLARHVAIHVLACDDERAALLSEAARSSARLHDRRILRVLDTDEADGTCFVVNEWGAGRSLDVILAAEGPMAPRRAAWICSEVAEALATGHEAGVAHGRLVPENVLIDVHGNIRLIGLAVDAALHGLPTGRRSADVTDLAGVLYACLTGRWAGVSDSTLPPAHLDGEQVLRPRRVRAGIPRVLDQLCDGVLNGRVTRSTADLTTVAGIAALLEEYVGDPTGLPEAEAARMRSAGPQTVRVPVLPPDASAPETAEAETAEPDTAEAEAEQTQLVEAVPAETETEPAEEAPEPARPQEPLDPTDVPTQAGMPVFDDERDQVAWVARSAEKPPPPPDLDEPAPRPLFAPEPEAGRPVRTPRAGSAAASADREYWPWESSMSSSTGTGTGAVPPYETSDHEAYDDSVPGRGWLRTAMVIGAAVVVLLVVVFALGVGRGDGPLASEPEESSSPSESVPGALQPVEGVTALDFDPQGDPPEENREDAPLAVDGDPTTAWSTSTYTQNLGPAGLKTGVGLVLDLGEVRAPRQVEVSVVGDDDTAFSLYLTSTPPTGVRDLSPLGTGQGTGTVPVSLGGQDRGRYLVVWLTSLPQVSGGYQGQISDVTVAE